jgi:D-beta-D-heptose 7-phosphate kinase/D-beta-D-heptose 1-phosphate adenosyltransferase
VLPHKLVKGGDYQPHEIVGEDCVSENGGEVIVLDYVDGLSSSGIIERVKSIH